MISRDVVDVVMLSTYGIRSCCLKFHLPLIPFNNQSMLFVFQVLYSEGILKAVGQMVTGPISDQNSNNSTIRKIMLRPKGLSRPMGNMCIYLTWYKCRCPIICNGSSLPAQNLQIMAAAILCFQEQQIIAVPLGYFSFYFPTTTLHCSIPSKVTQCNSPIHSFCFPQCHDHEPLPNFSGSFQFIQRRVRSLQLVSSFATSLPSNPIWPGTFTILQFIFFLPLCYWSMRQNVNVLHRGVGSWEISFEKQVYPILLIWGASS